MAFPERFLEELTEKNDIVDVVGSYVQLTKRTGANLFGLCPFHSEKTPSFSVNRDRQIYHCFGCGKGGGVINFVMEIENLPFTDAVANLAKRVGMTVPEDDRDDPLRGRRTRILELNKAAARYYFDNLSSAEGSAAVEYIHRRGIDREYVVKFGLGVAKDSWHDLTNEMLRRGFTESELLDSGLSKRGRNGGLYDVFRNRLMFPVIDVRGSVLGFSGRILGDGEPKYLNSPDTPVFSKSRNLFALNLARRSKMGMLILVEGNIDVVSLHQAGIDCAVASLGTALTPEQARLMTRYTDNVVIAYDGDGAGVKAAQRAIGILEPTGLKVRVLKLDGAKDPDEYIRNRGADAFHALLERSENHIEYRLLNIRDKHNLATDEGRVAFLSEATELISALSSPVEREVYGARAAEYAGVSPEAVRLEAERAYKRRMAQQKNRRERAEMRPDTAAQPKGREIRYENIRSAAAEEGVIRLLMLDPGLVHRLDGFGPQECSSPELGKILGAVTERLLQGENVTPAYLSAQLTPAEMSLLTAVMQKPESQGAYERTMKDYIEKIRTEGVKAKAKDDLRAVTEKFREKKGYGG